MIKEDHVVWCDVTMITPVFAVDINFRLFFLTKIEQLCLIWLLQYTDFDSYRALYQGMSVRTGFNEWWVNSSSSEVRVLGMIKVETTFLFVWRWHEDSLFS
jgi:hypothetical protein